MDKITLVWMDLIRMEEKLGNTSDVILQRLKNYGETEEKRINKGFGG